LKPQRPLFAQTEGQFHCCHAGLFNDLSEKKGYRVHCRNPRCSFQCWEAWARKEAAIDTHFLSGLPDTYTVFRGNMMMPDGADHEAHEHAKPLFSRAIRQAAQELGAVVKFKAVAHVTSPHHRHYDYLAYTDGLDLVTMQAVIKAAAAKAGFVRSTCRPCDRVGATARYTVKTKNMPARGTQYRFLPIQDGSRLVWASQRFYGEKTKQQLWAELREKWFSQQRPQEQPPAEQQDDWKARVRYQLLHVLPEREDEAVNVYTLKWLIKLPPLADGVKTIGEALAALRPIIPKKQSDTKPVRHFFDKAFLRKLEARRPWEPPKLPSDGPGVCSRNGRYWLNNGLNRPHAAKLFREQPVPYHEQHFPYRDLEDIMDTG
jgi:hypothetical protein